MGIPLSSLSAKLGVNVLPTDIFLISNTDSTQDNKITQDELSKSFTGLYAQGNEGLTFFENSATCGLSVSGSNGFVGINNRTPFVSFDVIDNLSSTNGSGQIRISTPNSGRKIALSISDPNVYYEFSKKSNDKNFYLESSIDNGASFSNLLMVDQSGNFAIHGTTGPLTDKFLVSGDSIQFQNSGNALLFDPFKTEIKTSATDEILLVNYNNIADINLGYNAIYIDNSNSAPKIGLGHSVPSYLLHLSGIGQLARYQSSNAQSYVSYKNSTATSYCGLQTNKIYFGGESVLDEKNLVYTIGGSGFLGLGTTGPLYKLDVRATDSTDNTPASFQNTNTQGYSQIVVACNKAFGGGDTGPRNSFITFSRYDASANTSKWSVGNLYNDTTFTNLNDYFVFVKNGYGGASPDVVAKISPAGNLDIDGSYTSSDSYCKGKFIQTYQTRVTGYDIYFNPLFPNSNTNPSGHNSTKAPFGLTNFPGTVERVMITTSDDAVAGYTYRFEISAVTQIYNPATPDGYVSGFSVSPASNPVSFPTSGIIGYTTFSSLNDNITYVKTKSDFNGSTTFQSGQMLQYRLCETNGTKTDPINFTVVTTIAYTVT